MVVGRVYKAFWQTHRQCLCPKTNSHFASAFHTGFGSMGLFPFRENPEFVCHVLTLSEQQMSFCVDLYSTEVSK